MYRGCVGPGDGFEFLVGDLAEEELGSGVFERLDFVEGAVADELVDVEAAEDGVVLGTVGDGDCGFGAVGVVVGVVAAKDFRVEFGPDAAAGSGGGKIVFFGAEAPGMAGGANADDGLAGGDVLTEGVEVGFGGQAATGAD